MFKLRRGPPTHALCRHPEALQLAITPGKYLPAEVTLAHAWRVWVVVQHMWLTVDDSDTTGRSICWTC